MVNKKLRSINLFFVTAKTQDLNLPEKVTPSEHSVCAQAVADLKAQFLREGS